MNILSVRHAFGTALAFVCLVVLAYILLPLAIIVAVSFGTTGYVVFPPQGFTFRWYGEMLNSSVYVSAFGVSLWLASVTTAISVVVAVPAAYGLVRFPFPGSRVLASLLVAPLMMPGLVMAVALTVFFAWTSVSLGGWRLVLSHLTICIPCVIRVTLPMFQRFDWSVEEAAMNLGANRIEAFLLVIAPGVRPGVIAAASLSFIMSFDETDMAVFLSSPRSPPLTVALYSAVQNAFDPVLAAVSACLVLAAFIGAIVVQLWHMRRTGRGQAA